MHDIQRLRHVQLFDIWELSHVYVKATDLSRIRRWRPVREEYEQLVPLSSHDA